MVTANICIGLRMHNWNVITVCFVPQVHTIKSTTLMRSCCVYTNSMNKMSTKWVDANIEQNVYYEFMLIWCGWIHWEHSRYISTWSRINNLNSLQNVWHRVTVCVVFAWCVIQPTNMTINWLLKYTVFRRKWMRDCVAVHSAIR